MVADRVQIRTLSMQDGSQAVEWESNGSPEYTIKDIEKETRGTDIVLHLSEDSDEFMENVKNGQIILTLDYWYILFFKVEGNHCKLYQINYEVFESD